MTIKILAPFSIILSLPDMCCNLINNPSEYTVNLGWLTLAIAGRTTDIKFHNNSLLNVGCAPVDKDLQGCVPSINYQ